MSNALSKKSLELLMEAWALTAHNAYAGVCSLRGTPSTEGGVGAGTDPDVLDSISELKRLKFVTTQSNVGSDAHDYPVLVRLTQLGWLWCASYLATFHCAHMTFLIDTSGRPNAAQMTVSGMLEAMVVNAVTK